MMPGIDPRRMQMMMRQMGVQMDDIPDVKEVIVRTATKEYRIRKATVSIMKAQGTETWQVQGKAEVVELASEANSTPVDPAPGSAKGAARAANASSARPAASAADGDAAGVPIGASGPAAKLDIPDLDVRLVMEQTGKDRAACLKALQDANGDIATAIVQLGG